jgi:hypothetical protein
MEVPVRLLDPLPESDLEEIMALATTGERRPLSRGDLDERRLSRGDFVVAMYLMNLLVDCRAGRDRGPKYLPDYLPEWLKAAGTSLNSGADAEAALKDVEDTVNRLGPPRDHKSSSTGSRNRERPQNEHRPLLGLYDGPPPSYSDSGNDLLVKPLHDGHT